MLFRIIINTCYYIICVFQFRSLFFFLLYIEFAFMFTLVSKDSCRPTWILVAIRTRNVGVYLYIYIILYIIILLGDITFVHHCKYFMLVCGSFKPSPSSSLATIIIFTSQQEQARLSDIRQLFWNFLTSVHLLLISWPVYDRIRFWFALRERYHFRIFLYFSRIDYPREYV